MPTDCIFCQIVAGIAPADIFYRDERVTAFQDAHPIAPVHILIVPNRHINSVNEVQESDENMLGHMISIAKVLAKEHGVQETGYRLVFNTGRNAGQSVWHLHLHLIGGRHLPFHFRE